MRYVSEWNDRVNSMSEWNELVSRVISVSELSE